MKISKHAYLRKKKGMDMHIAASPFFYLALMNYASMKFSAQEVYYLYYSKIVSQFFFFF